MAIRIRVKGEDGVERWYWLRFNDYGYEMRPYIYVQRVYKDILTRIYRVWANPEWGVDLVREFA